MPKMVRRDVFLMQVELFGKALRKSKRRLEATEGQVRERGRLLNEANARAQEFEFRALEAEGKQREAQEELRVALNRLRELEGPDCKYLPHLKQQA